MPGDTAQQECVIMVLAPQKIFIMGQLHGDAHFMAGGTELSVFVERLQKSFLMEFGLRFDQLLIHELEEAIRAESEGIMHRLLDGVISIAASAVDIRDCVTGCAGDPRLRGGMLFEIKLRVVKCSAQEGNHVMTACAPARGLDVAISLQGNFARFANAEQVRLIVERAEMMRAMEPTFVGVLVALQAIIIHH